MNRSNEEVRAAIDAARQANATTHVCDASCAHTVSLLPTWSSSVQKMPDPYKRVGGAEAPPTASQGTLRTSEATAMQQVLVRMPRDMHAALLADASANDRSMAATVRRAVKAYLGGVS